LEEGGRSFEEFLRKEETTGIEFWSIVEWKKKKDCRAGVAQWEGGFNNEGLRRTVKFRPSSHRRPGFYEGRTVSVRQEPSRKDY